MITIGIVNWNTKKLLQDLLDSIYADDTLNAPFEVVVVDNGSTDGSASMIENRYKEARLIKNRKNAGFTVACNQIMRDMKGGLLLLVNTDVVIFPGTISQMVEFMKAHPETGACGCKLLNADGTLQLSAVNFHSLKTILFEQLGLDRLFPRSRVFGARSLSYWDHSQVREVGYVSGAFMMIRRAAIEDVGEFDEDFFLYVQEADWCYRASNRGWRIYYFPEVQVIHYGGVSTEPVRREMSWQLHKERLIFFQKHNGRLRAIGLLFVMLGITALRMVKPIITYSASSSLRRPQVKASFGLGAYNLRQLIKELLW